LVSKLAQNFELMFVLKGEGLGIKLLIKTQGKVRLAGVQVGLDQTTCDWQIFRKTAQVAEPERCG